ncbi:MAG: divalent-cation tolerance protein CutA [Desulfovibrionaceae bacterium]
MEPLFVYMTAADTAEAERIGRALVEARLAACVNVLPGMRSFYWWDGAVRTGDEAVLVAKTTRSRMDALTTAVQRLHSYEVPCIAALPIVDGNAAFLDWIRDETSRASE